MGIKSNSMQVPSQALFPTGTPAELKAAGHNLLEVHSCAIPVDGRIRGCPHARVCALRKFGNPDDGGFGPPDAEPGTAGKGPKNVGYYIRTQEGSEKEDWIRCSAYMTVLFPREEKQDETGEQIMVVAQEGEVIEIERSVAQDPKLCNKNGNVTLITTTEMIEVPRHLRPAEVDRKQGMRQKMREARRAKVRGRRLENAGYGADDVDDPTGDEGGHARTDAPAARIVQRVLKPAGGKSAKPTAGPTGKRKPGGAPAAGEGDGQPPA